MKKYTKEQYIKMAEKFNNMPFKEKIKTIKENQDIISLVVDYDHYRVMIQDKEVEEELQDSEQNFHIKPEWGYNEIYELLKIVGIDI